MRCLRGHGAQSEQQAVWVNSGADATEELVASLAKRRANARCSRCMVMSLRSMLWRRKMACSYWYMGLDR